MCEMSSSHKPKMADLTPIWALLHDNSDLNSGMAIKWYTWLRNMEEVLYFFEVICQISRSHEPKNRQFHGFGSDLGKIARPVAAIKSLRLALFISKLSIPHLTTQITKTLGSPSIRRRSDTFASDRCLIDGDPMVFVTGVHLLAPYGFTPTNMCIGKQLQS